MTSNLDNENKPDRLAGINSQISEIVDMVHSSKGISTDLRKVALEALNQAEEGSLDDLTAIELNTLCNNLKQVKKDVADFQDTIGSSWTYFNNARVRKLKDAKNNGSGPP